MRMNYYINIAHKKWKDWVGYQYALQLSRMKYFVGPVNGILIIIFESMKGVSGNGGEFLGLDHLLCQEVPKIFIIVSDTSLLVNVQTLMMYIQCHI